MSESVRARHRRQLFKTASSLQGVFNLTQARACGVGRTDLWRWQESGLIERLLPETYCFATSPATWERAVAAAACWGGGESALSFATAACLWQLEDFRRHPIEVSTMRWRRAPPGLKVHRCDGFLLPDIVEVANLPVTSVPRTLLDLAGTRHPNVEPALDHALRRRLVTLGDMWLIYERDWIRGRRGAAILRDLLAARSPHLAPGDTELEAMMLRLMRRYELPEAFQQHPVVLRDEKIYVDFAYPDRRLAVECDSYAWHMDRRSFERDRERDVELQARGWTVLRFTWAQIKWRPEYVHEQIRKQLDRRPQP